MRIIVSILFLSVCYGTVIKVPADYTTIQSGIDAAMNGDTVVVYPDLYNENIIIDKSITLTSLALFNPTDNTIADSLDDWVVYKQSYYTVADTHINNTIINGSGSVSSTVTIKASTCIEPLILGFTIQGGSGTPLNRIYLDPEGATYTVEEYLGGGILSMKANPTLHYNKIYNNGGLTDIRTGGAIYTAISDDDVEFRDSNSTDCENESFDYRYNFFENNTSSLGRHIGNRFFEDEFDLSNCVFDYWNCQNPDYQTKYWVNIDEIEDLTAEDYQSNSCLRSEPTYVDPENGNDDLNDGSEDSPFFTITNALAAVAGSENAPVTINLSEGTYSPSTNGETYPIDMISHINLIGQGEEVTVLDADGSEENPRRVITMERSDNNIISDLTIKDGNTEDYGGGIYIVNSYPNLNNITISGNSAYSGGGIYLAGSNPTITYVTISGNTSDHGGGGMFVFYSDATLTNMTISGNVTTDSSSNYGLGGGITLLVSSNLTLTYVTISGNTADGGGGIYLYNSHNTFTNVTISGNTADGGGGMSLHSSNPTLTNMTIANNTAIDGGGGMYLIYSSPKLTNSILWGNSPDNLNFQNPAWLTTDSSSITITYSDIEGGEAGIVTNDSTTVYWGDGNIDADPLFTDPVNGDFTLQNDSPCIGTGQDGADMGALGVGCEAGCTDSSACNYNSDATHDDGNCLYTEQYYDCVGNCNWGYIKNCSPNQYDDSAECCSEEYIGDTYCDGWEQNYDCDLSCYDCDGGDCLLGGECVCDENNIVLDECGVCGGDGTAEGFDCDGNQLSLFNSLIPEDFNLHSIYPNPFNPTTTISFSIPEFGLTTITAYDITGRQLETITNEVLSVGNYSINWNASSYPSGVYLIRMISGEFTQTQKVVLVK